MAVGLLGPVLLGACADGSSPRRPGQSGLAAPGSEVLDLDRAAVERVRAVWSGSSKPVLIGESGLDAQAPEGMTITSSPRAGVGLGHAIWAELASGSASARALYWEDGYAVYYPATGLPLVTQHADLEREAARWLAGKDFRDLEPVTVSGEPGLFGAALVDATRAHGWARSELLTPPDWSAPLLDRALVRVPLPPGIPSSSWAVVLTRPEDGARSETVGSSSADVLSFAVEGPFESVAFDASRGPEAPPDPAFAPVCPSVEPGACVGPVYGAVLNGTSLFDDPECPSAAVNLEITECRGRWRLSVSSCPTDDTLPRSCVALSLYDIENQASGEGTYFDATGTPIPVLLNELELELEGREREVIRAGTLRGSMSGADAGSLPFELAFRGCSRPASGCLL
jgi:hypothetical protein